VETAASNCESVHSGSRFEESAGKPWSVPAPLPAELFSGIRRKALLEHCKWDAQVGDIGTLADFPLLLQKNVWQRLAGAAEALTTEGIAAERELLHKPEILEKMGWPRSLRKTLLRCVTSAQTPAAARTMRFDFHFATEGWRISEVNSDVPGGFTEATSFTRMMAAHYPEAVPAGDPLHAWAESIVAAAGENGVIALLTAPGFMEDHQIMAYLANHLQERGCRTHLAGPLNLDWRDGQAFMNSAWDQGRLSAVVRFYQSEWLADLPGRCRWTHLFHSGRTPVANPGYAVVLENKRFPLVWDELETPLPTWRNLLPETRDPREAPWNSDEDWLLKTALCNTGDTVSIRSLLSETRWNSVAQQVRRRPEQWVAQKRFQPVAVETATDRMYPCIGVYTINGKAAGCYARLSRGPVVDYLATDVALLLKNKAD
jgi:glutathionylspermidine synthase